MRDITIVFAVLAGVAPPPALAQRGGRERFSVADANGDGSVTKTEFASYRDANFGKLDRNNDDVVSPAGHVRPLGHAP